jgi:hypothetical protein
VKRCKSSRRPASDVVTTARSRANPCDGAPSFAYRLEGEATGGLCAIDTDAPSGARTQSSRRATVSVPPQADPHADEELAAARGATVFGVQWRSRLPVIGFDATSSMQGGGGIVERASASELRAEWDRGSEMLLCLRLPNGRPIVVVQRTSEAYRIRAPRYGAHVVAADGRSVRCVLPSCDDWRWQRLLYAQVLPLAAQLQGFDMLHASAVCVGDTTVAFSAVAGTGKSTLAANLVARGHAFVTDDVLAVSTSELGVIAHAGPRLLGLARSEYESLPEDGQKAVGSIVGYLDKLYLETPTRSASAPLRLFYFLVREGAGVLEIREQRPPDPRQLLGAAFLSYLQTDGRLVRHLDVCAAMAAGTRVYTAHAPAGLPPNELAARMEDHMVNATVPA